MIMYIKPKPSKPKIKKKRKLNSEAVNTSLPDYHRFIDIQSQLLTKIFLVKKVHTSNHSHKKKQPGNIGLKTRISLRKHVKNHCNGP